MVYTLWLIFPFQVIASIIAQKISPMVRHTVLHMVFNKHVMSPFTFIG